MAIIFLGTNGWYDSSSGNTICVLIRTNSFSILLDAGNGLAKVDSYGVEEHPAYIFLSHFHLDHIIGLHVLNKFRFREGLHISGQKGTRNILNTIINSPFSMPIDRLGYKTEIHELPEEEVMFPFHVDVLPLLHTSPTIGFRFSVDGRLIAYCPDTGYCDNAVKLGRDADLLIAECSYRPGESSPEWPHFSPETAARVAYEASAKSLALVHFDASRYTTMAQRKLAEKTAKAVFPNVIATVDGQQISL